MSDSPPKQTQPNADGESQVRAIPTPRELMKAWHPDLFADTKLIRRAMLRKEEFEYLLHTLTSRKQEYEFEHFCRKLAERELCPNLRVQTGPTGGGDSKVDTETYPVAATISERYWIGSPASGSERWAFAFSAKEDWRSKLRADVRKIQSTDRDYRRIYFMTNQFVRDKQRAEIEDTFSVETGITLHIVDRSWLVDRVYKSDPETINGLLSVLGVVDDERSATSQPGPRDDARSRELKAIDKQIEDPDYYREVSYQLVEDCLRSAILARGLGRSRNEIDGRFQRAHRLAKRVDYDKQRLRVAYHRAWTAFWWYEDYDEFSTFYDEVEAMARLSVTAEDIGRLKNLWMLLRPSLRLRRMKSEVAQVDERTATLRELLVDLAEDRERPNNAAIAQTDLVLIRVAEAYDERSDDVLENCWRELGGIVSESDGLVSYPLVRLYRLVSELGRHVDSVAFDALYRDLAAAIGRRRGAGEAGRAHTSRGRQKLKQERPYEAIRWLGEAEGLLATHEYTDDLIETLLLESAAFEAVGLYWASRNKALAATDRALSKSSARGKMVPAVLGALVNLTWCELRLGRIAHVVRLVGLSDIVASALGRDSRWHRAYANERMQQEYALSALLLQLPMSELRRVTMLPDSLGGMGLPFSRMALLFALGYEEQLVKESEEWGDGDESEFRKLFSKVAEDVGAWGELPEPILVDGDESTLRSVILGIQLVVDTPNSEVTVGVAESILGAVEAILATSKETDLRPLRERATVALSVAAGAEQKLEFGAVAFGSGALSVICPRDLLLADRDAMDRYRESLREVCLRVVCEMVSMRDMDAWLTRVIEKERGLTRSLAFGDVLVFNRNLFGRTLSVTLSGLASDDQASYPIRRHTHWQSEQSPRSSDSDGSAEVVAEERAAPNWEAMKHTDRRVITPIDFPLWAEARWRAVLYVVQPGALPLMGLAFENREAAEAIFRSWIDQDPASESDDMLRVLIVTGLVSTRPAEYAIALGANWNKTNDDSKLLVTMGARVHRMQPRDDTNLSRFLEAYRNTGRYLLSAVQIDSSNGIVWTLPQELIMVRRGLEVREAWTIAAGEADSVVLQADDSPVVPDGVEDPPVEGALARIRGEK